MIYHSTWTRTYLTENLFVQSTYLPLKSAEATLSVTSYGSLWLTEAFQKPYFNVVFVEQRQLPKQNLRGCVWLRSCLDFYYTLAQSERLVVHNMSDNLNIFLSHCRKKNFHEGLLRIVKRHVLQWVDTTTRVFRGLIYLDKDFAVILKCVLHYKTPPKLSLLAYLGTGIFLFSTTVSSM